MKIKLVFIIGIVAIALLTGFVIGQSREPITKTVLTEPTADNITRIIEFKINNVSQTCTIRKVNDNRIDRGDVFGCVYRDSRNHGETVTDIQYKGNFLQEVTIDGVTFSSFNVTELEEFRAENRTIDVILEVDP